MHLALSIHACPPPLSSRSHTAPEALFFNSLISWCIKFLLALNLIYVGLSQSLCLFSSVSPG